MSSSLDLLFLTFKHQHTVLTLAHPTTMPSFRGIEMSIITTSDVRKLPEYPHPDGSSVRLMRVGTGLNDLRNGGRASPLPFAVSSFSDADPTRQKKVNPRTSVYIPSSPGKHPYPLITSIIG